MAPPSPPPPWTRRCRVRVERGAIRGFLNKGVESGKGLPLTVMKRESGVLGNRDDLRW